MEIVKTQKLLSSVLNANAQKIKVDSQLDSVWTPEGECVVHGGIQGSDGVVLCGIQKWEATGFHQGHKA